MCDTPMTGQTSVCNLQCHASRAESSALNPFTSGAYINPLMLTAAKKEPDTFGETFK